MRSRYHAPGDPAQFCSRNWSIRLSEPVTERLAGPPPSGCYLGLLTGVVIKTYHLRLVYPRVFVRPVKRGCIRPASASAVDTADHVAGTMEKTVPLCGGPRRVNLGWARVGLTVGLNQLGHGGFLGRRALGAELPTTFVR